MRTWRWHTRTYRYRYRHTATHYHYRGYLGPRNGKLPPAGQHWGKPNTFQPSVEADFTDLGTATRLVAIVNEGNQLFAVDRLGLEQIHGAVV